MENTSIPTLFPLSPHFDGATYDPLFDQDRLSKQLGRVFDLTRDGEWHTLDQIAAVAGGTTQSISARLRDLRKPKFGRYNIQRRRCGSGGLFEYRIGNGVGQSTVGAV